ncbi:MAG TPA: hypothetical protein VGI86_21660, partial [Acidimicrobiia bacterium]
MDASAARVAADATDERSCADRGRDAVEQAVGCVQQRLSHYRATGQFAVTFGWPVLRRKLAATVEAALGRSADGAGEPRTAAEAAGAPWPAREAPEGTDPDADVAPPPEPSAVSPAPTGSAEPVVAPTAAPRTANGHDAPAASQLAIPGYDSLSASQVVERLAGLPSGDLA